MGRMGALLGPLGVIYDALGTLFEPLGAIDGPLGAILESRGTSFGPLVGRLNSCDFRIWLLGWPFSVFVYISLAYIYYLVASLRD
jgi:hypothetical protein